MDAGSKNTYFPPCYSFSVRYSLFYLHLSSSCDSNHLRQSIIINRQILWTNNNSARDEWVSCCEPNYVTVSHPKEANVSHPKREVGISKSSDFFLSCNPHELHVIRFINENLCYLCTGSVCVCVVPVWMSSFLGVLLAWKWYRGPCTRQTTDMFKPMGKTHTGKMSERAKRGWVTDNPSS